ncbi:MAG TPA: sodium/solute symporter [Balneolales bacterium]|nr:sodium/solute symporter [Balneolales bacterium]
MEIIHLSVIDWAILLVYIGFIVWMGFYLKRYTNSDEDFFLAGRKNSAWVAGIAFMSANMGAMEVIGYAGQSVKYGLYAAHFYLIGAIPAMLFLGVFMMPFYYKNRIKSIPGYSKERFDEKTRVLNAITFALMMILVSGIALYALALVLHTFVGWNWDLCIWLSAGLVALYVTLSGLLSAIFTEVVQFFLIWAGILLIPILGLVDLKNPEQAFAQIPHMYTAIWSTSATPAANPMMVSWGGLILGLGFAIGFGYWTTDFLIIQRAFSAKDLRSAQMTPIIGSYFKLLLGFVVVGSGMLALTLLHSPHSGFHLLHDGSRVNYDSVIPLLMMRYFPSGMIGLGVTTLVAMFMAGQAGNMSAFTAVWTYDIYQSVINPDASKERLLWMGRMATMAGIVLSIGGAYWARSMPTIIDFLQAIASFILAPTAAVILLGMFWKRITADGAFWGLLLGIVSSLIMFLALTFGLITNSTITPATHASVMAANFWRAFWAWLIASVGTIVISFVTEGKTDEELKGLVKGLSEEAKPKEDYVYYRKPEFWATITLVIFVVLNIWLW